MAAVTLDHRFGFLEEHRPGSVHTLPEDYSVRVGRLNDPKSPIIDMKPNDK